MRHKAMNRASQGPVEFQGLGTHGAWLEPHRPIGGEKVTQDGTHWSLICLRATVLTKVVILGKERDARSYFV